MHYKIQYEPHMHNKIQYMYIYSARLIKRQSFRQISQFHMIEKPCQVDHTVIKEKKKHNFTIKT